MKHTSGPWRVFRGVWIFSQSDEIVADVDAKNLDHIANAKLIAAAPELLEALKMVQQMLTSGELVRDISLDAKPDFAMRMLDFVPKLNKIMMAIAKAEGRG